METLIVRVTPLHIARGERKNCKRCPFALAIADALPDASCIFVDLDYAVWTLHGSIFKAEIPGRFSAKIDDFDILGIMNPIAVRLKPET
jgi:hypothetical protein